MAILCTFETIPPLTMTLSALVRVFLLSASVASALMLSPGTALAEGLRDHLAQSLKADGDAAMTEGRFAEALSAYERGAAIEPSPILDYNRGRALQALGRNADALLLLERFQREADPELRARVPKLDALLSSVRARVGTLKIECNVAGARVRVGGRPVAAGAFPASLKVDAGLREISVEADGFVAAKRSIDVPAEGSTTVALRLERLDRASTLRIISDVVGARVSIDGAFVGQVPLELTLSPGAHRVRVDKGGYESNESQVVVRRNEWRQVKIDLESGAPIYARWWLWTGVGVAAAATTLAIIALTTERAPDSGDIPPGRVAGPLVRF